jgi:catechol 2,3-dioxygenase-like lactoylglutathione lyase family enzyme
MTHDGDAVIAGPGFYLPARLAADRGDLRAAVSALPAGDADHPGWFVAALPGPDEEREVARTMDALPPGGRLFLLIPPPHQTPGIMRTLFSRGTVREIVRQPDAVLLLWSASATPSP